MKPPSGGPASGPTSAGMVRKASAFKSSLLGTSRSTMMRPTGTISAPPNPCKARAATSPEGLREATADRCQGEDGDRQAKDRRAPKRSAHQPLRE